MLNFIAIGVCAYYVGTIYKVIFVIGLSRYKSTQGQVDNSLLRTFSSDFTLPANSIEFLFYKHCGNGKFWLHIF